MKNLNLIVFTALTLIASQVTAQQRVALHSAGTTSIFSGVNPFLDAYNAAIEGDTIYLPGGNLPYPTTINKGLVIYGAGHYPDFSEVTSPTILNGGLNIGADADNLKMEGLQINGNLNFAFNSKIDSVEIRRCRITGSLNYQYSSGSNFCEDNTIYQCVVDGDVILSNTAGGNLSNSYVRRVVNGTNWGLSNNIFSFTGGGPLQNLNNSFISGNIFLFSGGSVYTGGLNNFAYNVFLSTPAVGNSVFENNYNEVDLDGFFVNQSGFTFSYDEDYHLSDPASFPGVDGTEVGLYGGLYPYKEGAVPSNPHFIFKDIDIQTNPSGQLNVNIQVEAQNE